MIARIYGIIDGFSNRGVYIRVGGIVCEVLLTGAEKREIELKSIGEEISLHTLFIMEGKAGGGSHSPMLIGFQNLRDREFFELFISVEGIGVGSALKMLVVPINGVARAIEDNNLTFLCSLKQVGERTARKIVAGLMGKVGRFALEEVTTSELSEVDILNQNTNKSLDNQAKVFKGGDQDPIGLRMEQLKVQALEILEQLGYSAYEAKKMLTKVFENQTHFSGLEEILNEIYRGDIQPRDKLTDR